MKEQLLNELQRKYEYLNFSDAHIFKCFEDAYLYIEDNFSNVGDKQIGILHLEMEYHFLTAIKGLLKVDKDIYDSVFLRMTSYFEFFKRKRRDLTQFYSEDMCLRLYQTAFSKTVLEPASKEPFRAALMRNLIEIFKNEMNNLFTILGEYEETYYNVLFSTLTGEEENLLKRKFGPSFDGKNMLNDLKMIEQKKLASLLDFMSDYLITFEDTVKGKHVPYKELVEALENLPRDEHISFLNKLSVREEVKVESTNIEIVNPSRKIEENSHRVTAKESTNEMEEVPSLERLSYLDALIYKGYICFGNMKTVKEQLLISEEKILSSILNHFYLYENDNLIKEYLFTKDAMQIRKMITFFAQKERTFFTTKEEDYMYLLACKRQNPILTDDDILNFLSLTRETVKEYRPMTKNDFLNDLYVYIKK